MNTVQNDAQFKIDCCTACSNIIKGRFSNMDITEDVIAQLVKKYNSTLSNEEMLCVAKEIYKSSLHNDKYGINKLKEVNYA